MRGAWGNPKEMRSYFVAAVQDYENCVESQPLESHPSLAALLNISSLVGQASWMFAEDKTRFRMIREGALEELGQRLVNCYQDCCRSAKVGQIGTREDYYYEEPVLSSLRVLL